MTKPAIRCVHLQGLIPAKLRSSGTEFFCALPPESMRVGPRYEPRNSALFQRAALLHGIRSPVTTPPSHVNQQRRCHGSMLMRGRSSVG